MNTEYGANLGVFWFLWLHHLHPAVTFDSVQLKFFLGRMIRGKELRQRRFEYSLILPKQQRWIS